MNAFSDNILAIDPGHCKCGLAIVDSQGVVLQKMVVESVRLTTVVSDLRLQYSIGRVALGDRTQSKQVKMMLLQLGLAVVLVDENNSSIEGRARYLRENTRGWQKLLPLGLRVPDKPYDDYVAVILAERYFQMVARSDKPSSERLVADKEEVSE